MGACWIGSAQATSRVNSVSGRRAFADGGSLAARGSFDMLGFLKSQRAGVKQIRLGEHRLDQYERALAQFQAVDGASLELD